MLSGDPVMLAGIQAAFQRDADPEEMIDVDGVTYFAATSAEYGRELWKSDGTAEGTVMVKDIVPGSGGSGPEHLMNVGGTLFFIANDGLHNREIWRSDGTAEGTWLVKDVFPGPERALWWPYEPLLLAADDDILYFAADAEDDGTSHRDLWKTDGTEQGTVKVADSDISPNVDLLQTAINFDGTVYFSAYGEIYRTDGTTEGTIPITNLPGSGETPLGYTEFDGRLFFRVGNSLWATNGEVGGEVLIKTLPAGSFDWTVVEDTLYFRIVNSSTWALWKSDGTTEGTLMVRDFGTDYVGSLLAFNDKLVFTANTELGYEPWISDGTLEGTVLLKDILPGSESSNPNEFVIFGDQLFFTAVGPEGAELWTSNGTEAGTVLFQDLNPGAADSAPWDLVVSGDTLFFAALNPDFGRELWKTNGTVAGTELVKDIHIGPLGDASPRRFTQAGEHVYFIANSSEVGIELWRTDGTPAGTELVSDISPENSVPFWLTEYDGKLVFGADDGETGAEPWITDGTEEGTVQIKDISTFGPSLYHYYPFSYVYAPEISAGRFTPFQGELFFAAIDDVYGLELWKTDGTGEGTVLVKDIEESAESPGSFPGQGVGDRTGLVESGGSLFFFAYTQSLGAALWKTDGTETGTVVVKQLDSFGYFPYLNQLTDFDGTLFFTAYDETHGVELWKSDGTEAGTMLVKDLVPGAGSSNPYRLTVVDDSLFFFTEAREGSSKLWKSDGTEAGTVVVKDVAPYLSAFDYGQRMTASGGMLFFAAEDDVLGAELWISDGTEAGTRLVADIFPGSDSAFPREIIPIDGGVAFTVDADGSEGGPRELWVSDGSAAGTYRASEFELAPSGNRSLAYFDSKLYFSADEGDVGLQPWVMELSLTPVANAGGEYLAVEGDSVVLTAAASQGLIDLYEWDLDNDGQFDDATGPTVNLPVADDGQQTIAVRVTGPGGTSTDTAIVTASNKAPTAAIGGTTDIYRGETVTFTLLATDPSPLDQADLFTFEIDWDGDGNVDETLVDVPSGTTVLHTFPTLASTNIQVRATDKDGSTGDFSQAPITVSPHVLRAGDGGSVDLIWGGTSGVDVAFFLGMPSDPYIFVQFEDQVLVNRFVRVESAVTGKIIAYGYGSSDVLVGELIIGIALDIHGGDGDDIIVGGSLGDQLYGDDGDDLILGGTGDTDGDDLLFGGMGRDTLFGHYGADTLNGGGGEDLLISDRFIFGDVPQAVQQIANEWKSSRPLTERVSNLLGITATGVNGSWVLVPNLTIVDDGSQDTLIGGIGNLDWYFYDFAQDLLGDTIEPGEEQTNSDL